MGVISRISQIVCLIMCVYGMWLIAEDIYERINRRYHLRKVDARIIKQAKELGVWDDGLNYLRGRALELKAWEDFKIKREPGETDAELRRRYMKEHNKREAYIKKLREQMGAALQIPTNILYGGETVTSTIEKSEDE